jgi:hypothetical protein
MHAFAEPMLMNAGQHIRVSQRGNPYRLDQNQDKDRHGPRARARTATPRGLVGAQPRGSPSPPWGEDGRLVRFPLATVPVVWIGPGTRSISVVEEPRLIADPSRLRRRPTCTTSWQCGSPGRWLAHSVMFAQGGGVRRYAGALSSRQASQRRTVAAHDNSYTTLANRSADRSENHRRRRGDGSMPGNEPLGQQHGAVNPAGNGLRTVCSDAIE